MSRLSELPSSFYIAGGTLPPDSPSYISRAADDELFQRCLAGEFCYVLTSRQMGKSSLMAHTAEKLRNDAGTTVAIVDLSQIGTEKDQANMSADRWYYGVARMIQRSLGVEHDLKAWWREREDLPSVQRLTEFFTDVVLSHGAGRVLIFVDEIDTIIGMTYSDDFFAAIRACYNARATELDLRRLGFVLLGVASPSDLIADVRRTPFNIGHRIELTDFTFEEAMPLAEALATEEAERARQLRRILHWTGGHPYLTQRICELLAKAGPPERSDEQIDCAVASAFFDPAANRDEPNLRFVRDRLTNYGHPRRDLLRLYERIHRGEVVKDVPISATHSVLKLSGAVVASGEGTLRVRNEIYRHLFTAEWARQAMPVEWKTRLAIAASVVLLLGGFITWHWLVQPRNYIDVLTLVQDDAGLAESTAAKLRAIFGYSGRADELLANFWRRQALAAEGREDRDEAILYRCRALQAHDTNLGRRELNAMIQDDYPRLQRTFRQTSPVGGVIFSAGGDRFLTWTQDAVQLWNTGKTDDSLALQIRAGTGKKRELGIAAAGKKSAATTEELKGKYPGAQFMTVAFSPDGSKVLTGSDDRTARLWSAADGSPIGQPLKHGGSVRAVAFSPDGSKVLTGSDDNTARLWSAADGSPIGQPLKHEDWVLAVAFSPDGSKVLTCSDDNTARLWSAADGSPIGRPLKHEGLVRAVAFSPDGSKALTGSDDNTARLWSAADGSPIGQPLKHEGLVRAVAFSPDGSKALTASDDNTARLWSTADGSPIGQPLKQQGWVVAVAFSPDGSKVLTGSFDNTARLWSAADGSPIGQPLKQGGPVRAVAFSADGTKVLTGSDDKTARLWSAADDSRISQPLKHENWVLAVAFSPDGTKVLTGSVDNTAQLWSTADGSPIGQPLRHEGPVLAVAFSPDGSKVLTGSFDSTARLWSAADGSPIGQPLKHEDSVRAVAFSPDGSKVLTGSVDNTARLWSAADGSPIGQPLKHEDSVHAVAFSPDGSKVLTGSDDNTARLWSAADGSPIGQPFKHENWVVAVAFSPDGSKVLTGSLDSTARLWSAADGSPIGQPLKHEGPLLTVAFSPDGSKVLTGSLDNTARLWSAADGSPIGQPLKHEGWVFAVAFSPDGSKLMTSTDLWLHIFQLRSEAVLAIASWLKASPSFTTTFVEPSGRSVRMVTGVVDGKLATVTFKADLPAAEAITGRSEALSRDWQRRLALQFTADGKIVPALQQ